MHTVSYGCFTNRREISLFFDSAPSWKHEICDSAFSNTGPELRFRLFCESALLELGFCTSASRIRRRFNGSLVTCTFRDCLTRILLSKSKKGFCCRILQNSEKSAILCEFQNLHFSSFGICIFAEGHLRFGRSAQGLGVIPLDGSRFFLVDQRWNLIKSPPRSTPSNAKGQANKTESKIWNLKSEIWILDSEIWNLESGIWNLDSEIWNLESGIWIMDYGIWILDYGFWNLESLPLVLNH